jgi:mannosyltransferase OCH1-like enzyme
MPDFELVLWNEASFDVHAVPFTKEAYESKKYAFVSDYVRLFALASQGGIYLDTDVEIIKPLDEFIKYQAFGSFETPSVVQTGVVGSVPNGTLINNMFSYYQDRKFISADGIMNQTPNSKILTDILLVEGLILNNMHQSLPSFELFPTEYFCPINQATQEIVVTKNTYCIHYLSGSWLSKKDRLSRALKVFLGTVFGYNIVNNFRSFYIKVVKRFKNNV